MAGGCCSDEVVLSCGDGVEGCGCDCEDGFGGEGGVGGGVWDEEEKWGVLVSG